jgi:two-component system, cell cycle sensor histidine kinase and response regulator CckA
MVGAMLDVTEKRRLADVIRESEERYRELVEGLPDAIFTVSREGIITSANHASEVLLGWQRDEWIGRVFLSLIQPSDQQLAVQTFLGVLRGERPPAFELRLRTKTGGSVTLEFTVSPQHSGDKVVGLLGVARDVTERERLQEQVRQAQKMEAVGRLSGGIAHDFNNLLTVIQLNATLLAKGRTMATSKEHATEILEATERAATLTRQLLLVSRKQAMQPAIVDLNAIVADMTKMLRRIVGEDISLETEAATDLPLARADVGMLEQVLLNLAVNARDAMPAGGVLTIATAERDVEGPQHHGGFEIAAGRYVGILVRDTGIGIAPDVLPRIFDPFFTTKELGKGTGLGLATVYAIVRQHRGWIEVASEPGRGTTFRLFIPVARGAAVETHGARPGIAADLPRGAETILVAEDEASVRLVVVNLLEHCGYTVLHAATGAEALGLWKSHKRDVRLILTDVIMPGGINGRDLAARVRQDAPDVPIIYVSGYTADLGGEALVEGLNFLQKPYAPARLAQLVRARLDDLPDAVR